MKFIQSDSLFDIFFKEKYMMKHWKKASLGIALGCCFVTTLLGCGDINTDNNTNAQTGGGGRR